MKRQLMRAYDNISREYGGYRRKRFPQVLRFLNRSKAPILDIGCASLGYLKDYTQKRRVVGIDLSFQSLKRANSKLLIQADAAELPIKNNKFSQVSMLATLHHLPTDQERLMALLEIKRVLKKNGKAIITVWKRWQKRFFPNNLLTSDHKVPWGRYKRFYHLFTEKELRKLIKAARLKIVKLQDIKNNLVAIINGNK